MFNYLYKLMHGESSLEKTMREARDKIAETEKLTDKQIMSDIKHSRYMLELEQKSLGPSVQFDKINEEFKNVIETRLERLNNAKTFIANANKKLEELGKNMFMQQEQNQTHMASAAYEKLLVNAKVHQAQTPFTNMDDYNANAAKLTDPAWKSVMPVPLPTPE